MPPTAVSKSTKGFFAVKRLDPYALHPDAKVESLVRRRFEMSCADARLLLKLRPGCSSIGAVLDGWLNPVPEHDALVAKIEGLIEREATTHKEWTARQRHSQQWEMLCERLASADLVSEYADLKLEFADLTEGRVSYEEFSEQCANAPGVKDPIQEVLLMEGRHCRFKELRPQCERILDATDKFEDARQAELDAMAAYQEARRQLEEARALEAELATKISQDHVRADMQGVTVASLFPTTHVGHVMSAINDVDVENAPFDEVLRQIDDADLPHKLKFRRYDFSWSFVKGRWESLQELRELKQYVVDARISRRMFVDAARESDLGELRRYLDEGQDINCTDDTTCTAMHHAAARGDVRTMTFLLDEGAKLEANDKNSETPLLHAVRKGQTNAATWLVAERRANVDAKDRQGKTAVMFAISSQNVPMLKAILNLRASMAVVDKIWGWTPLHFAANAGSVEMVDLLLRKRASCYARSNEHFTPLEVAQRNGCGDVAAQLVEQRFREPAQPVYGDDDVDCVGKGRIWIGSKKSMWPRFFRDRGFTAVLSVYDNGAPRPDKHKWIDEEDPDRLPQLAVFLPDIKDAGEAAPQWEAFVRETRAMVAFVAAAVKDERRLLIQCDSGVSSGPCVLAIYMMMKRGYRAEKALERMRQRRRQVKVSPALERGLGAMQASFDERMRQRMEARLRDSQCGYVQF